jgi:WD40 repeat protein
MMKTPRRLPAASLIFLAACLAFAAGARTWADVIKWDFKWDRRPVSTAPGAGGVAFTSEPNRPAKPLLDEPAPPDEGGDELPKGAVARLWDHGVFRHSRPRLNFSLAFSPDGKTLASASLDRIILWDQTTGKKQKEIKREENDLKCVCWSDDGRLLAVIGDGALLKDSSNAPKEGVCLLDVESGKKHGWYGENANPVICASLSADGKVAATGGIGEAVCLWDSTTGKEIRQLKETTGGAQSVAFSPDGKMAASASFYEGFAPKPIRLWDVTTGKELPRIVDKGSSFSCVAFSPDGKWLAAGDDGKVRLFDSETWKEDHLFAAGACPLRAITYSPDGKTLATGDEEGGIRLFDSKTGEETGPIAGHSGQMESAVFADGGRTVLTVGGDGRVLRWDSESGKLIEGITASPKERGWIAVSPDGRRWASWDDNQVRVRDLATSKLILRRTCCASEKRSLYFARDGKRLVAVASKENDAVFRVLNIESRRWEAETTAPDASLPCVFSGDGKLLATTSNRGEVLHILTAASGEVVRTIDLPTVQSIAFSPDDRKVAGCLVDESIFLVDLQTGKYLQWPTSTERDGDPKVGNVVFSPDGRMFISGGFHHLTRLWEVATQKECGRFDDGKRWNPLLAFSPDGKQLLTAGANDTNLIWRLDRVANDGRPPAPELSDEAVQVCWDDLNGADAAAAYQAVWRLAAAPKQAAPFLLKKLRASPPDAARVRRLLADIDDDAYATREQAAQDLEALGEAVEAALKKTLEGDVSVEVQQRVKLLLQRREAGRIREVRAVQALEYAGDEAARDALERLSRGPADSRLTQDARASLRRLDSLARRGEGE